MAYPFVLFENYFEDGTITADSEQSGYPDDNIIDWRMATPFRWKSDSLSDGQKIHLDMGSGVTATPDTIAFGGHNLSTCASRHKVWYSDNNTDWTAAYTSVLFDDDYPTVKTFTGSAHRYWKITFAHEGGGAFTTKPEAGIITLGRRLDFTEGVMADLDPYGFDMKVEQSINENGSPIGANVLYERKQFVLNYDEPGFTVTDFYDPSSGLGFDDDFAPHIKAGYPFWFVWNIDTQADGIWLCRTTNVRMPFVGSTNRRGLYATFDGYREVA